MIPQPEVFPQRRKIRPGSVPMTSREPCQNRPASAPVKRRRSRSAEQTGSRPKTAPKGANQERPARKSSRQAKNNLTSVNPAGRGSLTAPPGYRRPRESKGGGVRRFCGVEPWKGQPGRGQPTSAPPTTGPCRPRGHPRPACFFFCGGNGGVFPEMGAA